MGKPQKTADGLHLEWVVSPWKANWKRPVRALVVSMALTLFFCFTLNYPNYSVDTPPPGQAELSAEEIAEREAYRDNWVSRSLIWSLYGILFVLGMTATIYLPVRYRLDEQGVTTWFLWVPTSRPWGHYRNYYVHPTGVHLTTMSHPSPLDAFRGHYLQFGGNKDEVMGLITARIERPEKEETGR